MGAANTKKSTSTKKGAPKKAKPEVDYEKLHKSQISLFNEGVKEIDFKETDCRSKFDLLISNCFGHVPQVVKDLLYNQILADNGKEKK